MPRFSPEELERLKKEVSLVELVEAAGIELRGQGENLLDRCPWHEQQTLSPVLIERKAR